MKLDKGEYMNICVTVNSKYMRYLYVMLQSLYENNKREHIDLYVIENDFTQYDKNVISDITNDFSNKVFFINAGETKFDNMPNSIDGRVDLPSEILYFRLLIPELLPTMLDRVLLLDVDLVINRDISELYNIDFEEKVFAAAPNMCHNFTIRNEWKKWYPKGRSNWIHYNTGVLLWNLKMIRDSFPNYYLLKQVSKQKIGIATFEEELFNILFGENLIKGISAEKWNYIATHIDCFENPKFKRFTSIKDMESNCRIVHYAARNPWQDNASIGYTALWWKYAKKSPFYEDFITAEKLLKDEKKISELNASLKAERLVISIYDFIYHLKGSQKLAKYFNISKKTCYLYGAGIVAEKFYNLLEYEKSEKMIKGVFDKNKIGEFHGIHIYRQVDEVMNDLSESTIIIVTPSREGEAIAKNIVNQVKGKTEVVLIKQFLEDILNY